MCGIVACNTATPALQFLVPGLRRLEYRGYDSIGVAVQARGTEVVRLRSVGRLAALERLLAAVGTADLDGTGIGHTRWATHGVVSRENSHPHVDCAGDVHVVHNGIIENAEDLRAELSLGGHRFRSDVDSEIVAHLVEEEIAAGAELGTAVAKAASRLCGSWALGVLRRGHRVVIVTAHHSPLVVAQNDTGSVAASDLTALAGWADVVQVLGDGDVAALHAHGIEWISRGAGQVGQPDLIPARMTALDVELGSAPDHMSKEILEQASTVADIVERLGDGVVDGSLWRSLGLAPLRRVRFVGCGTSLNAARILARLVGSSGVPSTLAPASELDGLVSETGTVSVALSQSGETADVLRALERPGLDSQVLALTNNPCSSLGRAADAVVALEAGPEIGVAATKTFTAQVVAGAAVLLSGLVAGDRMSTSAAGRLVDQLALLPDEIEAADRLARERCPEVVDAVVGATGFLFVARGASVPYAAEGALKLKELTYRWADCEPAGELKHGPIALIEAGTPVVVVDDAHPKLAANIAEVRTRRAHVIRVGGPGTTLPYRTGPAAAAPWGPLPSVVALQHLARDLAVALGRDVDKPRNLAKSVTVE